VTKRQQLEAGKPFNQVVENFWTMREEQKKEKAILM
jgi:hypothetical protein